MVRHSSQHQPKAHKQGTPRAPRRIRQLFLRCACSSCYTHFLSSDLRVVAVRYNAKVSLLSGGVFQAHLACRFLPLRAAMCKA